MRARPENEGVDFLLYEDHCLEVGIVFSGMVSGIPVPTGDPRVITVDVCAYAGKDATRSIFNNFSVHCVLSGAPRWGKTFLPKVGRWTTITGDGVGTYSVIALCGGKTPQQCPDHQARACRQNAGGYPDDSSVGAMLSVSL